MDHVRIAGTGLRASRIALGTWAIGGWMWGGTDEERSIATIRAAVAQGVNLIDTAPVYGFGASEEIVGRAVAAIGGREKLLLSTKCTLDWKDGRVFRNGSGEHILREVEDSLRRLKTDWIDIYFIHWPDCRRGVAEAAKTLRELFEAGTIRAIGVSNFTPDQMRVFADESPLHLCQPPYNLFERGIENGVQGWCERSGVTLMTYGALCRGLLSGRMTMERTFSGDDLRQADPKFQAPRRARYLAAAARLSELARTRYGKSLAAFSVRWVLERGVPITIWGGRTPEQMAPLAEVFGWSMDLATLSAVDGILAEEVPETVGAEFMAPPTGLEA
jgi:aryl-alcohol dehydrogenase-like predicted oxidoreductase